ncbi:Large neutral amino acids transporter small subunit 1 [Branchiostoma belcheri]|nr:Large neutral amino acids transporter small subunit 1 [Branchiostoma belcheri]
MGSDLEDSPASADGPRAVREGSVALKRKVTLINAIGLIVGNIIGSGIFISPKGVLQDAGNVGVALIIWAISGVISAIGALCYADLGTAIPRSGGDYSYILDIFGPLPAFLRLWVELIIVRPCTHAVIALTFAFYILYPVYTPCTPPDSAVALLAALCICLLTFVNCASVRSATRVQDLFTAAKLLALAIIIIFGMIQLGKGEVLHLSPDLAWRGATNVGGISLALYSGLWAFAGWADLTFVTEEIRDPSRNVPRSIVISMTIVTIVYLLANVAYFTGMTPQEMLDSDAVAVTFGLRLLGAAWWIIPIFVAFSTFGAVNGSMFASASRLSHLPPLHMPLSVPIFHVSPSADFIIKLSLPAILIRSGQKMTTGPSVWSAFPLGDRLYFVGAREGHLPDILAMVNVHRYTPVPSLILGGILSLIMLCTTDVYVLINYASFVYWIFIGMAILGLVVIHFKYPSMERPVKMPVVLPIIFVLACLFIVVVSIWVAPIECLAGAGITLTGVPVYFFGVYWQNKPKWLTDKFDACTVFCQKIMTCCKEEHQKDVKPALQGAGSRHKRRWSSSDSTLYTLLQPQKLSEKSIVYVVSVVYYNRSVTRGVVSAFVDTVSNYRPSNQGLLRTVRKIQLCCFKRKTPCPYWTTDGVSHASR